MFLAKIFTIEITKITEVLMIFSVDSVSSVVKFLFDKSGI